jgi:hypothetical protein
MGYTLLIFGLNRTSLSMGHPPSLPFQARFTNLGLNLTAQKVKEWEGKGWGHTELVI